MLFRINFNRALLISIFWHAFCFFMFTVVIMPANMSIRPMSDVAFLGAILDEGYFTRDVYSRRDKPAIGNVSNKRLSARTSRFISEKDYFLSEKPYKASVDEVLYTAKILPDTRPRPVSEQHIKKERDVLYRPPMPDFSGLLSLHQKGVIGEFAKVKLKIIIAPDGEVRSVENLQTCGSPEIDLAAARYAKKWKFVSLSPSEPQVDQEAVISLDFKIQ